MPCGRKTETVVARDRRNERRWEPTVLGGTRARRATAVKTGCDSPNATTTANFLSAELSLRTGGFPESDARTRI